METSACKGHNKNLQLVKAHDAFVIEKSTFSKSYLNNLIKSNNSKEKTMLNLVVTKIVKHDHKDSFEYLLDHGYKIDVLNDQNQTAIHLAIYNNADNILKWGSDLLLSKCTNNLNHTDNNGLSHLHFACMVGKKNAVKKYLENNADINARWYHDPQDNRDGFTPLHFAVMNHKTEIVKFLLYRGADIHSTDSSGRTAFHLACCVSRRFSIPQEGELTVHADWNSEMKIMKLLVTRGAHLNLRDKLGNTPLLSIFKDDKYHRQIKSFDEYLPKDNSKNKGSLLKRQKEKLDYLMELGVDITVTNDKGENILHRIIGDLKPLRFPIIYENISFEDEFHAKLINQLLALKCGIDANEKNCRGQSPLLYAITFLSLDIVKVLLDHNADVSDLKFDYKAKNFFNYPTIYPNLKSIRNLSSIINLLADKGFEMTLQDKLTILKYLIHEHDDCECCDTSHHLACIFNMYHTFLYGDLKHIDIVLGGLQSFSKGSTFEDCFKYIIFHNLYQYCKLCKMASMYYPKESYRVAKENNCCDMKAYFELAKSEITRLQRTVVAKEVTLYDLLAMDLDDIYDFIEDEEVDKLFQRFLCYRDILEGRIAKSLSITYFLESACDYIRKLTVPSMPDECCDVIIKYLDIHDLMNACLAAVDDGLDNAIDLENLRL